MNENEFKHENNDMHFAMEFADFDYHQSNESLESVIIIQAVRPNNKEYRNPLSCCVHNVIQSSGRREIYRK